MMKNEILKAVDVLKNGGIILYPTDTVWGIGCDATNAGAVEKIYKLKHRSDSKSMLVLVDSADRIARHVKQIPDIASELIELSNTPLTIIYPQAMNLAPNLIAEDGTTGIRVVKHEFCKQLIFALNRPIVSTSANVAGEKTPREFNQISQEILNNIDLVVNRIFEGNPTKKPSAIIKLGLKNEVEVIRK
ncbi:MAG: threonylcarbamoyl-AMP synthase [Prevotellaceae bacterium]|jgi:L-threonylcarbamoyladenylate synthase|nr:threonylcarbamoyl-AMP synthase [Prevotellaceae bacterium]